MQRRVTAIVAGIVGGLALAGCGGSGGISLPCSPQPQGRLCITVFHDGKTVKDAIGYLSASESPLAGKTWRLVLTAAGRVYPGPTRHGNPPRATSCRASGTTTVVTTPTGCHDTLAAEYASHGDFSGFAVPKTLAKGTELCLSEQIRVAGGWQTQTTPGRVCSRVG